MTGPPKWPHEPDGGYPIGAKSPGDDPVQFEAAVRRMVAYAKRRRLDRGATFVEAFSAFWAAAVVLAVIAFVFWTFTAAPPRELVVGDEIILRPNFAVHFPFVLAGGACAFFGLWLSPGEIFPWLRENKAWREMSTPSFKANFRNEWLAQGAVGFSPQRALLHPRGAVVWGALAIGAVVAAFGLWLRVLGERDVHRVTPRGFTSVAFWTSQETRHSFAGVVGVEIDCSKRRSGRNWSWVAEIRYSLSSGKRTVVTLGHRDHDLFAVLPAIDEAVRAASIPVTWDPDFDRQCILEFTRDRDPDFTRAFDRFMHFLE